MNTTRRSGGFDRLYSILSRVLPGRADADASTREERAS